MTNVHSNMCWFLVTLDFVQLGSRHAIVNAAAGSSLSERDGAKRNLHGSGAVRRHKLRNATCKVSFACSFLFSPSPACLKNIFLWKKIKLLTRSFF